MTNNDVSARWPRTERSWPKVSRLEALLNSGVGKKCHLTGTEQLGGRSLLLQGQTKSTKFRLVALRQRSLDIRQNLPLREEAVLLSFLVVEATGLAIEPVYFHEPKHDADEPILLVQWKDGERLGDMISPSARPAECLTLLKQSLEQLHSIGCKSQCPQLSRVVDLNRLLSRAKKWNAERLGLSAKTWERIVSKFSQLAPVSKSATTLLHGDPHVYNLILNGSRVCWFDFECASIGPPEVDFAKMLILLIIHSGRLPDLQWSQTKKQHLCNLLIGGEWLQNPPILPDPNIFRLVQELVLHSIRETNLTM
jgi:aminoglycoside phosphotransferase (APT) family kinase protein